MSVNSDVRAIFLDLEIDGIRDDDKPMPNIREFAAYDPARSDSDAHFTAFVKRAKKKKNDRLPSFTGPHEPKRYKLETIWAAFLLWAKKDLSDGATTVLVGHNVIEHDKVILKSHLESIGKNLSSNFKWFDTLWFARTLHIAGDKSLQGLREHFNIEYIGAHTGAKDTVTNARVFNKLTEGADEAALRQAMVSQYPYKSAAALVTALAATTTKVAIPIIFDLETTGLIDYGEDKPMPRIVEIAALAPTRAPDKQRFHYLINPEMTIPKEAVAVHGITDEMVADQPTIRKAMEAFNRFCDDNGITRADVILIGHNAMSYDWPLLKSECARAGVTPPTVKLSDTLRISRSLYSKKRLGKTFQPIKHNLQELRLRHRVAENVAHRAMGDVETTWGLLQDWCRNMDDAAKQKLFTAMAGATPILEPANIIANAGGLRLSETTTQNPIQESDKKPEKKKEKELTKRKAKEIVDDEEIYLADTDEEETVSPPPRQQDSSKQHKRQRLISLLKTIVFDD